ncbi:MAG TPA: hypothetical protein VMZ27_16820 [Candidatus Saccharimonadales bacterium]|nr:hypothetical protein [Candidatus Saccharimonadales bacterium]
MSLKALHIVFVTVSILLCVGVGVWSLVRYFDEPRAVDLIFGIGSLAAAVGLGFYGRYVLKKLKNISYL